jgi:hypothetical protein
MTDIPTGRGLGRTRGLLTLLAVLILAAAVAAVAYGARQREPQAAAEPRPPAQASPSATPGSAGPATAESPAAAEASLASGRPTKTATTKASRTAPRPPDSVVQPAVADPAARLSPVPQQTLDAPPTCGQWRDRLTDAQRLTYAGGQLRAEWQIAGSAGGPPTNTVREFRTAITSACGGGTRADSNVSDVAHAVYVADPGAWGP